MPSRKKSDTSFDDKVAGAFARNGLNTILLDLKEDTGATRAAVQHIQEEQEDAKQSRRTIHEKIDLLGRHVQSLKQTVDDIAPKVLVLDTERAHKIGQRKLFHLALGAVTKGRAAVVAVSAGAVATWHQWPAIKSFLRAVAIIALPLLLIIAAATG